MYIQNVDVYLHLYYALYKFTYITILYNIPVVHLRVHIVHVIINTTLGTVI